MELEYFRHLVVYFVLALIACSWETSDGLSSVPAGEKDAGLNDRRLG